MRILAIDSSSSLCAACVWQDGQIVAQAQEKMERGQDARLLPMIIDVMQQAGCAFADLDKIAAVRGPGSFTGVRVGVTTANTLAWSLNIPVFGFKEGELKKILEKIVKSRQKKFSKIVLPYYL